MNNGMVKGILSLAVGLFLIYWAQTHTPNKLGKIIENELSGSYTLPEHWYYICLGLGIIFGIVGVLKTYKSMK